MGWQKGWFANWPINTPVRLGQVGSLQTDTETRIVGFRGGNTLEHFGITAATNAADTPNGDINLTTGDETRVRFGADGSVDGWKWLGSAKAGFHATFGSAGGMHAELADVGHSSLEDLHGLREKLRKSATSKKLPLHSAVVVEINAASEGMIVASTTQAADLKVSTDVDLKPAKLKLASFAGSFSVKHNQGSAVVLPMDEPFTVAFRTLVVGTRGIWWWKRIEISGVGTLPIADLLAATEDSLSDDDFEIIY